MKRDRLYEGQLIHGPFVMYVALLRIMVIDLHSCHHQLSQVDKNNLLLYSGTGTQSFQKLNSTTLRKSCLQFFASPPLTTFKCVLDGWLVLFFLVTIYTCITAFQSARISHFYSQELPRAPCPIPLLLASLVQVPLATTKDWLSVGMVKSVLPRYRSAEEFLSKMISSFCCHYRLAKHQLLLSHECPCRILGL